MSELYAYEISPELYRSLSWMQVDRRFCVYPTREKGVRLPFCSFDDARSALAFVNDLPDPNDGFVFDRASKQAIAEDGSSGACHPLAVPFKAE